MNKRVSSLLISLLFLALSTILLLVYFIFNNDSENSPLSLYGNDISLQVGESVYNYYQVSNKDAEISFYIDKEGIISIDKNKITGVNAGEVCVNLTAKYQNQISKTQINVKVYNDNYTIQLNTIENCYFEDSTLFMTSNVCAFQLEVFDKLNNKIDNLKFRINTTNSAQIIQNLFVFQLKSEKNCTISISLEEIDFNIVINVIRL